MATAALPQDPDLGQLRNQARELERAVRGGEPTALARVSRWHPEPPVPDRFPLTAAQLVLAREHGFASWARLRRYVKIVTDRAWTPGKPAPADESLVTIDTVVIGVDALERLSAYARERRWSKPLVIIEGRAVRSELGEMKDGVDGVDGCARGNPKVSRARQPTVHKPNETGLA